MNNKYDCNSTQTEQNLSFSIKLRTKEKWDGMNNPETRLQSASIGLNSSIHIVANQLQNNAKLNKNYCLYAA